MNRSNVITVSITRTVKLGCEMAFERALRDFVQRSLLLPGQMGVHIMRPPPGSGSREYRIIAKFSSREALTEFRISPEHLAWNQIALELTEAGAQASEMCGLESWFILSKASLRALPKWKMSIATFAEVLTTATLLNLTLGAAIRSWPFIPVMVVLNAGMVILLTWVVRPLVTHMMHNWLHPERELYEEI